jgi:hypothetical protein
MKRRTLPPSGSACLTSSPAMRRAFIGMNNYDAGRMAGELVKQALPDGGKVLLFIGRLEQDNGRQRTQGVIDEILGRAHDPARRDAPDLVQKAGRYEVLGVRTDQFDKSTAKANAADALTAQPDLGCMVGLYAYNTPAIPCTPRVSRSSRICFWWAMPSDGISTSTSTPRSRPARLAPVSAIVQYGSTPLVT